MKLIGFFFLLAATAVGQTAPKVDGCSRSSDKLTRLEVVRCDGETGGILSRLTISVTRVYPSPSDTFGLKLFSNSRNQTKLLKRDELNIVADDAKVNLGSGTHNSEVYGPIVTESLFFTLSREHLAKIAGASSVELHVGKVEGKLDRKMLKKLKALVTATK